MIDFGSNCCQGASDMVRKPLLMAAILLGMLLPLTTAMGDNGVDARSRGARALSNGQFAQAVAAWTDSLVQTQASGDVKGEIDALTYRSLAYQQLGNIQLALADLKQ